jgi:ribosomal-protein-alanine N-acetyltransferase
MSIVCPQHLAPGVVQPTTMVPFPFTEVEANWFINMNKTKFAEKGYPFNYAIRDRELEDKLIGICGIQEEGEKSALVGYWIAPAYWGQGLMTCCVKALVEIGWYRCDISATVYNVRGVAASAEPYSFEHFGARIFAGNMPSVRVVEKAGFTFSKNINGELEKNGQKLDADLYQFHVTK